MEEEGRIELCSEEQVYEILGLGHKDEREEEMAREAALNSRVDDRSASGIPNVGGTEGAYMLVDDYIPETMMMYDKDNPTMAIGTIYPCMEDFQLAMSMP